MTVRNSIVAANRSNSTFPDTRGASGAFLSDGYNLIGVPHSITAFQQAGDQNGNSTFPLDPRLAPLGIYNGTTPTHSFLSNSPAVEKGNSFGLTTDQRNRLRPFDNPLIPNTADGSDIGAFESRAAEQNQPPVANPDSYTTNRNIALTVNTPGVRSNDTDADGDPLTATKVSDPSHGTVQLDSNGAFTYTPSSDNFTGTDSFTYRASDGVNQSNAVTVTLTISQGANLIVTKTEDTKDGVCDNDCSLREAIAAAQPGNVIEFSSLFNSPQTIALSSATGFRDLVVDKNLTINGRGANLLKIQRLSDTFRIFNVNGSGMIVNFSGFTVSNGNSIGFNGGGINISGGATLNLDYCRVSENRSGSGGGIYVANGSRLFMTHSTVSGNIAASGGGIYVETGGNLIMMNSTVSGNSATGNNSSGGGIHNQGTTAILNSTVSGNVKTGGGASGGGIWTNNRLDMSFTTIADNQAFGSGSASGIFRSGFINDVSLYSTLVAANRDNANYPDLIGAFRSYGYNLIGNVGGATGFPQAGDQLGTATAIINPKLAPLDYYGGATPTHALPNNSPARAAADPMQSETGIDQRGVSRGVGGRADIGAFELSFVFQNSPAGSGGLGTLPNGFTAQPYSVTFTVFSLARFSESNEANLGARHLFTIIAGSLPNGLTLDAETGELSGTPTQAGTYPFVLRVTDTLTGLGGVWSYVLNVSGPTAAEVSISGRVLTLDGRGLRNAFVTLMDSQGNSRTILSGKLGSFRFAQVSAGETYIVSVAARRYVFAPQVTFVSEDLDNLILTAIEQTGSDILQP